MAKAKKVEVKEEAIATEEIQQDEMQQEAPVSDRKVILAPLAKYGVVAVLMAGIIVTTAIMLNNEFNDIDAQVAALDEEIAQRNSELAVSEATSAKEIATVEETTETEVVAEVVTIETTTTQTALPEVTLPVATTPVVPVATVPAQPIAVATVPAQPVAVPTQPVAIDVKSRIAKYHEFLASQDKKQLETFKANQAKQIEMLRGQLAKQQEQITAIEMRNQKSYEMRVTAVKHMQDARNQSLDRI